MSNPYSSQSISNYNTSPPPDDGSQTASNEITWAGIKSKLVDPVKTLAEAINTAVSSAFTTFTATMASTYAALDTANTFTADQTIQSSDAGSAEGPILTLDRNSASPAANDVMGGISFVGRDSAANSQTYADIIAVASDPTSGSEDGLVSIRTAQAGSSPSSAVNVAGGLWMQGATGGDPGSGGINATTIKKGGVAISGLVAGTAATMNPIALNSRAQSTHGLGAMPDRVQVYLECLTAEASYAVGDRIFVEGSIVCLSGSTIIITTSANSTALSVAVASNSLPAIAPNSATPGSVTGTITAANWKLVATPYHYV